ncbi:MAG TPA: hypothetical protein VIP05_28135 [Burkholderiaceae bacterium]
MLSKASTVVVACGALLSACGGDGGSSGGTAQSIDFPYPGTRYLATAAAPLSATTTSGLPVTFSSNTPATCTVSDGNLVAVSVGECSITATQDGNAQFASALPAQQLFKILPHVQTITFASPGFQAIDATPPALSATSDSGLPVSFTSNTTDVCTVSATTLTLVASGQCSITASQAGDGNYAAAAPVTVTFAVGDAPPPVLTFASGYQSTTSTIEGGSISTYAGSNKDGWWCSDPNWCSSTVGSDGASFTFSYSIQPSDPHHPNSDNWMGGYFGFQIFAPGVSGFSSTGNTLAGVQIDKQSTLKFELAEDPVWFSTVGSNAHNADVKVTLVLGHFALKASNNNSPCNVALQATMTPSSASTQGYELQLGSFSAFSESCGLTGLDPATELRTYPVVQMKFDAATTNTSASTTSPTDPSYPTALTLSGAITFQ